MGGPVLVLLKSVMATLCLSLCGQKELLLALDMLPNAKVKEKEEAFHTTVSGEACTVWSKETLLLPGPREPASTGRACAFIGMQFARGWFPRVGKLQKAFMSKGSETP